MSSIDKLLPGIKRTVPKLNSLMCYWHLEQTYVQERILVLYLSENQIQ